MQVEVVGLYRYPVKSLGAVAEKSLTLDVTGLRDDRRWMVVDDRNRFLTQRQRPGMATLCARQVAGGLELTTEAGDAIKVAAPARHGASIEVQIWGDNCAAQPAGEEVNQWLSDYLQRSCRLVYLPLESQRTVAGFGGNRVGFADGYPLLLTSRASLAELNQRLARKGIDPVPMARFRPNIVVDAPELRAFAEDYWSSLISGQAGAKLLNAKPCGRCMVITTNQSSGERHPAREPLATLSEFRTDEEGEVLFGINLVPQFSPSADQAVIHLNDRLDIEPGAPASVGVAHA